MTSYNYGNAMETLVKRENSSLPAFEESMAPSNVGETMTSDFNSLLTDANSFSNGFINGNFLDTYCGVGTDPWLAECGGATSSFNRF